MPIFPISQTAYWHSTQRLKPADLPQHMLGNGLLACERENQTASQLLVKWFVWKIDGKLRKIENSRHSKLSDTKKINGRNGFSWISCETVQRLLFSRPKGENWFLRGSLWLSVNLKVPSFQQNPISAIARFLRFVASDTWSRSAKLFPLRQFADDLILKSKV